MGKARAFKVCELAMQACQHLFIRLSGALFRQIEQEEAVKHADEHHRGGGHGQQTMHSPVRSWMKRMRMR